MSELSNLVATVQAVASDLNQTRQSAVAYQQQLARYIVYIVDQTEGTGQTDIKDCLVAVRGAINSLQKMQESLGQAVAAANSWAEKNGGAGSGTPSLSRGLDFGSGYEPEEENTRRR